MKKIRVLAHLIWEYKNGLTIANQITPKNTDLNTVIRNTSKNLRKAIV